MRQTRHCRPGACLASAAALLLCHQLVDLLWSQGPSGPTAFAGTSPALRSSSRSLATARAAGEPLLDADGIAYARFQGGKMEESLTTDELEEALQAPPPASAKDKEKEEWFIGQIKSYAPQQGYGFIECEETFDKFNHDVFLHKNQVEGGSMGRANKGDPVRFSVDINKNGRPQARNVERYQEGGAWVSPLKTFVGRVKSYSDKLGYGFIACEDTKLVFKRDIFLHRNQMEPAGLSVGSLAAFSVEVSAKGAPQARNVEKFGPEEAREGAGEARGDEDEEKQVMETA